MAFLWHKYRISADGGRTWTEQWLTEDEARDEIKSGRLCIRSKLANN